MESIVLWRFLKVNPSPTPRVYGARTPLSDVGPSRWDAGAAFRTTHRRDDMKRLLLTLALFLASSVALAAVNLNTAT